MGKQHQNKDRKGREIEKTTLAIWNNQIITCDSLLQKINKKWIVFMTDITCARLPF